jgi:hypothetical protein
LIETEDAVSTVSSVAVNVFPQLEVRYSDGYKAAKAIVGFGNLVKTIGAVAGVIIALVALSMSGTLFIAGVMFGGLVWLGLFVSGIVICAQGQLLLATLDSAVNNSPFLDNSQRASIMSLSTNPASWSRTSDSSETGVPLQHTGLRCGKCKSFGPKVVAISPEHARCKACGYEWNPRTGAEKSL